MIKSRLEWPTKEKDGKGLKSRIFWIAIGPITGSGRDGVNSPWSTGADCGQPDGLQAVTFIVLS